tara:strand:- start:472 stop:720 length:249 start_codon:yes stop_codon:yes gene_type:complete
MLAIAICLQVSSLHLGVLLENFQRRKIIGKSLVQLVSHGSVGRTLITILRCLIHNCLHPLELIDDFNLARFANFTFGLLEAF